MPLSLATNLSSVTQPHAASLDEGVLVARARDGDMAAFEALFNAHAGRIHAVCLRMAGDKQRAREFTHDAFVRAWERLASFRGEAAFATWLHRLAVNVVLEAIRSDRRREARVALAEDSDEDLVSNAADFGAADVGTRVDLERAIALLPPGARHVFVLHDVEGYRHDEIATQMSIAPGTVRAHLHRARKLLARWLDR